MSKLRNNKGFTLIELLVVIAILGILAAVVLIAINPAERIAEANDTQVRSDIATVASAIEACFTASASGDYEDCDTVQKLRDGSFLKSEPAIAKVDPDTTRPNIDFWVDTTNDEIMVGSHLESRRAEQEPDPDCADGAAYYVYSSADASSQVVCSPTWWSP